MPRHRIVARGGDGDVTLERHAGFGHLARELGVRLGRRRAAWATWRARGSPKMKPESAAALVERLVVGEPGRVGAQAHRAREHHVQVHALARLAGGAERQRQLMSCTVHGKPAICLVCAVFVSVALHARRRRPSASSSAIDSSGVTVAVFFFASMSTKRRPSMSMISDCGACRPSWCRCACGCP